MPHELSLQDILGRLGLAFGAGFVVGLERESHGRAAGLRTTILVCVASALAMILSEYLFQFVPADQPWRPDPARLAAGILTGMGFLGAGSIIRQENVVRGVTTAASLWFVSVVGLAFGAGQLQLGILGVAVALVTLFVLPGLEAHIRSDWYGTCSVTIQLGGLGEDDLRRRIEAHGINVKRVNYDYNLASKQKTLSYGIKFKKGQDMELAQKLVRELAEIPSVLQVRWV